MWALFRKPFYHRVHGDSDDNKGCGQVLQGSGPVLNFETGQETPITLLRTIQDIGLDNLGINLDPANLLMYGRQPQDAVDMYGDYIRGVHVKDGLYPTDGHRLGSETPVGKAWWISLY